MYSGVTVFLDVTRTKAEHQKALGRAGGSLQVILHTLGGLGVGMVVLVQGEKNDPMTSSVPGEVGEVALE